MQTMGSYREKSYEIQILSSPLDQKFKCWPQKYRTENANIDKVKTNCLHFNYIFMNVKIIQLKVFPSLS